MARALRVVVVVFAFIGVVYVGLAVSIHFFGARCRGTIAMAVPSPSKAMFARVETRTCDEGPVETIVSLSTDPDSRIGTRSIEFFRAARAQEAQPPTYSPVPVRLSWLGESELEVAYPEGVDARTSDGTYDGITVRMRQY